MLSPRVMMSIGSLWLSVTDFSIRTKVYRMPASSNKTPMNSAAPWEKYLFVLLFGLSHPRSVAYFP